MAGRSPVSPGGGASGGLSIDDVYPDAVNVASDDIASMDLIEPGSTATSYLWHKINGTQSSVGGAGSQMPLGGPYLSSTALAIFETWITEGAPE